MAPHPTSGTTLSDHYASLLAAQAASGLTMQHFAALHGVSACTLYLWRRRLAAADSVALTGSARLVAVDVIRADRKARIGEDDARYEVHLANGLRLRLRENFTAARVAELVTMLRTC